MALRHEEAIIKAAERGRSALPWQQTISGAENPELFFPIELFDSLLRQGFAYEPETQLAWRLIIEKNAQALGNTEDLWPLLSVAARDFVHKQNEINRRAAHLLTADPHEKELLQAEIRELQSGQCRARAVGLQRARAIFGRETFDRFLYEAVAPSRFTTLFETPETAPETGTSMRWQEEGCP
jgi:hypothetical protein